MIDKKTAAKDAALLARCPAEIAQMEAIEKDGPQAGCLGDDPAADKRARAKAKARTVR